MQGSFIKHITDFNSAKNKQHITQKKQEQHIMLASSAWDIPKRAKEQMCMLPDGRKGISCHWKRILTLPLEPPQCTQGKSSTSFKWPWDFSRNALMEKPEVWQNLKKKDSPKLKVKKRGHWIKEVKKSQQKGCYKEKNPTSPIWSIVCLNWTKFYFKTTCSFVLTLTTPPISEYNLDACYKIT